MALIIFTCVLTSAADTFGQAAIQAWTARYNGNANGVDETRKMVTDGAGNLYVTGVSASLTGNDIVTIKYNSVGVQQWLSRYHTPASATDPTLKNNDKPYDLVVDAAGNVYVTGYGYMGKSAFSNYQASVTLKYNAAGVQQWRYAFTPDKNTLPSFVNSALKVDQAGNVYLATTQTTKVVTLKLNPAGVLLWRKDYASGIASALVVDASGNVYVLGKITVESLTTDFLLLKYNGAGIQQWTKVYSPSNTNDEPTAIALDASGNVYITGTAKYNRGASGDFVTLKYTPAGVQQWVTTYDASPGGGRDQVSALVVDGAGNVYITGSSYNDSNEAPFWEYATIKYNTAGVKQWVALQRDFNIYSKALAVDAAGNVYVTGNYDGKYGTFKYNNAGQKQWEIFYSSGFAEYSAASCVIVDAAGNVFVSGASSVDQSGNDLLTVKYFNYGTASTITSFAPANAPVGAGVAIRGVNFKQVKAVRFNGKQATIISHEGESLIIATVPAGATSGRIQVITNSDTASSAVNITIALANSAWQAKAPMPTARTQHGAVALTASGKVYAFGGANSSELNAMECYNTNTLTWASAASIPMVTRGMSYVLGSDNQIYLFGGYGAGNYHTQSYRYNPASNAWTALADMPVGVWGASATATTNGKVYVFGGDAGGWLNNYSQIYDIATNTWTENYMPTPVTQHQAIMGNNGKIYFFGGRTATGALTDLVQIYNPANNNWTTGAPMPIPKAQFAAAKNADGKIYIIGGKGSKLPLTGPFFNTVEMYNPATNTWETGSALPSPVGGLAATLINGKLLAVGGLNGSFLNSHWQLTLPSVATRSAVAIAYSSREDDGGALHLSASPNPFADRITLSFRVEETAFATLEVYDMRGVLVRQMFADEAEASKDYSFQVDGSSWPAGMYVSRLVSNEKSIQQKILIAR
ncbi:MAG: kelch repeat-containing protein [Bacteroidota bacterium]